MNVSNISSKFKDKIKQIKFLMLSRDIESHNFHVYFLFCVHCFQPCVDFNKNSFHWFKYFNISYQEVTLLRSIRRYGLVVLGMPLLEKVCHREYALKLWKPKSGPIAHSSCWMQTLYFFSGTSACILSCLIME